MFVVRFLLLLWNDQSHVTWSLRVWRSFFVFGDNCSSREPCQRFRASSPSVGNLKNAKQSCICFLYFSFFREIWIIFRRHRFIISVNQRWKDKELQLTQTGQTRAFSHEASKAFERRLVCVRQAATRGPSSWDGHTIITCTLMFARCLGSFPPSLSAKNCC